MDVPADSSSPSFKKRFRDFWRTAFAGGASLILGLLSFGGMYVLFPMLFLSISAFFLSVIYEFEIYTQNIEQAFEKLFTKNYFEHQLAKTFLKAQIKDRINNPETYNLYQAYKKTLDKKYTEKEVLTAFAKIYAEQLCAEDNQTAFESPFLKKLYTYLHTPQKGHKFSFHAQYKKQHEARRWPLLGIRIFNVITSLFMGLGTTYLLVDLFVAIPVLAAIPFAMWPLIITPFAAIAGIAYGLLTYNTMTSLLTNNTLANWYQNIQNNFKKDGFTFKAVSFALTSALLAAMAITLTVCTAGTWWTIAKEVPPLYQWVKRLPKMVMSILNPIIIGISTIAFTLENTSETLDLLFQFKGFNFKQWIDDLKNNLKYLWEKENPLQWINPFRLTLLYVIRPLKHLLFMGHILSISVTADRIPGISPVWSAATGGASETLEDLHYFIEHEEPGTDFDAIVDACCDEAGGHEHNDNLPARMIKQLARPFCAASAAWDSTAALLNKKENQINYSTSYTKQSEAVSPPINCSDPNCVDENCPRPVPVTKENINTPGAGWMTKRRGKRAALPLYKHTATPPGSNQENSPNQAAQGPAAPPAAG